VSDPFPGLGFPPPGGPYASVDDLLQVADLCEVDLTVTRWKKGGESLHIRVRALDFDQQEAIDRGSVVKLKDGSVVKSDARFAALTLKEAVIVPTLNDAQAQAMRKHNPSIVGAIVRFVWDVLSALDQEVIDGLVEQAFPDPDGAADDAAADADGGDEQAASRDRDPVYGAASVPRPALEQA
jgi:cytochrome b